MQVLIGLGNPGRDYRGHRHNIGFMAMDAIAEHYGLGSFRKKLNGEIVEGRIGQTKVLLVKPQTFMNRSGQCARQVLDFYKLKAESVSVFYDEMDLAPSKLRIKRGGGSGGHNGIKSLDAHIGQNYRRIRLGIGHPGHRDKVTGYVLHDFGTSDQEWLAVLLPALARELPTLIDGDEAKYSSKVLQDLAPQTSMAGSAATKTSRSEAAKPAKPGQPTSESSPAQPAQRQVKDQPTTALGKAFATLLRQNKTP